MRGERKGRNVPPREKRRRFELSESGPFGEVRERGSARGDELDGKAELRGKNQKV